MTTTHPNTLCSGFLQSVERFWDHPALLASGQCLTYAQLFRKAASLAATLSALVRANSASFGLCVSIDNGIRRCFGRVTAGPWIRTSQ